MSVYVQHYKGTLPLHIAATQGCDAEVVRMLLDHDESKKTLHMPANDGSLPIHEAFRMACENYIGRDPDSGIWICGKVASDRPAQSVVEMLIQADVARTSLLAKDNQGGTPLQDAARLQGNEVEAGLANPAAVLIPDAHVDLHR